MFGLDAVIGTELITSGSHGLKLGALLGGVLNGLIDSMLDGMLSVLLPVIRAVAETCEGTLRCRSSWLYAFLNRSRT